MRDVNNCAIVHKNLQTCLDRDVDEKIIGPHECVNIMCKFVLLLEYADGMERAFSEHAFFGECSSRRGGRTRAHCWRLALHTWSGRRTAFARPTGTSVGESLWRLRRKVEVGHGILVAAQQRQPVALGSAASTALSSPPHA